MTRTTIIKSILVGLLVTTTMMATAGSYNPETVAALKNAFGDKREYFFNPDGQPQDKEEVKNAVAAIVREGWHQSPSLYQGLVALVYAVGPLMLKRYLAKKLKLDSQARLLKLKKEQPAFDQNPLARLLMQLQQQGDGGMDMDDEVTLPDSAEPVTREVLEWNPDDILTPSKRRFYTILHSIAYMMSIVGITNAALVAKDVWRGHQLPTAVHHQLNQVNNENDAAPKADKIKEYADLSQISYIANVAKKIGLGGGFARWLLVDADEKK